MPLTTKAMLYLGFGYVFIGLAIALRQPAVAIFVLPIAFIFYQSSAFSRLERPKVTIQRTQTPSRTFEGEHIKITLSIRNDLQKDLSNLHVEDKIPNSLSVEHGTISFDMSLKSLEEVQRTYEVSAPRRGRYPLGPVTLTSRDLMGFRAYSGTIGTQDLAIVLPQVEDLGRVELSARRVGVWPGTVPSRSVGAGTEFFELRPYVPGDELRRINWKATAKRRTLVTNEFETERVTDVLLVVDCSEGIISGAFPYDAEEFEVHVAASLCSQLLAQGNRVGLLIYGTERTWVQPSFGKHQLIRILNALTITKAGPAIIPIDFAVQTIVNAVLPARSVVLFISPLMGMQIVEVIRNVASAGYSVICLVPSMESPKPSKSKSEALARELLTTERRVNVRQIVPVSRYLEISPYATVRALSRRSAIRKTV
jgi:uncharacterized protein (DUF58 family)